MCTEAEECLKTSFREIGKRYGYETVDAEFVAFKDFKVAWERSYRSANFHVSDYVEDAPKEVMECLAESIFSKIIGMDTHGYTDGMKDWALSPEFIYSKQPIYLRRSKNLTGSHVGTSKDLEDSLHRLKVMGLIPGRAEPKLSWTREMLESTMGYCSPVMNVIAVTSYLDMEDVPDYVIDFVVYHEYLILEEGRRSFGFKIEGDYRTVEIGYPRYNEAMRWLERAGLR